MSNQIPTEELETKDLSYEMFLADCLDKLKKVPEFKALILDHYLTEKPLAITAELSKHTTKVQGLRPEYMEELVAISNFGDFLRNTAMMGQRIAQDEEMALEDELEG